MEDGEKKRNSQTKYLEERQSSCRVSKREELPNAIDKGDEPLVTGPRTDRTEKNQKVQCRLTVGESLLKEIVGWILYSGR